MVSLGPSASACSCEGAAREGLAGGGEGEMREKREEMGDRGGGNGGSVAALSK